MYSQVGRRIDTSRGIQALVEREREKRLKREENFLFNPSDLGEDTERGPGRTWFERVFAPFEAPQQALYSLTRDIAEDGFQFRDLWNAVSHGVHYFNPWSDAQRISEEEINAVFFGEDSKLAEGWTGAATNIGIALLYDPLLVGGLAAKGARALGAGASTVRNIERISNPAGAVLEGAVEGVRRASPIGAAAARHVMGDRRYDALSEWMNIRFRAPSKNLPQTEYERLQQVAVGLEENRVQAYALLTKAREFGEEGERLLGRALEDRTIRVAWGLGRDQPRHQRAIDDILKELDAHGIDKDAFHEVVERFSVLAAENEDLLMMTGRLNPAEFLEETNRHLRRAYNMKQSPVDALRRLDRLQKLAETQPEKYGALLESAPVFDRVRLRESLMELADEVRDVRTELGQAFQTSPVLNQGVRRRYFTQDGSSRTFNVDNFLDDFGVYMRENPNHSVSDALDYIRKEMFGGTTVPEGFNSVIADYLAKGMVDRAPLSAWVDKFEAIPTGSGVEFRRWSERQKVLQERLQMSDEIANDVLWRQESPLVRMVEQIEMGGREALMSSLFDDVAGAVRLHHDVIEDVKRTVSNAVNRVGASPRRSGSVAGAIESTPEFARAIDEAADALMEAYPHLTRDRAVRMVRDIDSGKLQHGHIIDRGLDALGSTPDVDKAVREALGHTKQLPNSEAFGAAAGMYVNPYMAHQLTQTAKMNAKLGIMSESVPGIGDSILDGIRGLVSHFKFFKIVADPSAHMRDTIGSLASMDIMGVNPLNPKYWEEAMDMTRRHLAGETDELKELAHSIGYNIFGSTMAASELREFALRQAGATTRKGLDWIDETKNFWTEIGDFFGAVRNKASHMYQTRESAMRAYVFTSRYRGLEEAAEAAGTVLTREMRQNMARQAAEMTNKVMFNYADVPLVVEAARSFGFAPFITFPTKAVGQFADALYNRPWSVLKYDRVMNAWNENWAGGDEAFAREIQALPEYQRENLVIRLPWENKDGNALYLDLSYFLPWSAVRDLLTEAAAPVQSAAAIISGDAIEREADEFAVFGQTEGAFRGGGSGGIFSHPALQLRDALLYNRDGLGRAIYDESDSSSTKAMKMGRYLWQFIAPPTAPGGVTADSVGRSILAAARTSSEPVDWVEYLGLGIRMGNQENVLNRYGEAPTARALPSLTENPAGQAALGLAGMFLPVSESNAPRQARNSAMAENAARNDLSADLRRIAQSRNMTEKEKREEIQRLVRRFQNLSAEEQAYRAFIGY